GGGVSIAGGGAARGAGTQPPSPDQKTPTPPRGGGGGGGPPPPPPATPFRTSSPPASEAHVRALLPRLPRRPRTAVLMAAALLASGFTATSASGAESAASPAPPPATADCGSATICADFEDQIGPAPSGAWQFTAPDCQGTGTAAVDTAVAHSGSRSLRIDGRAGYCNHAFVASTADLSSAGPVMYVRMWVRHTTALPAAHVTFVSLPDASQAGRSLRVGGQNGALQWNRESDDATLPAQSPVGVALSRPLPTESWQCLRFAIDTTAPGLDTWLGDELVPGLHADGAPTQDIDQQWLSRTTPPRPTALRLGWESYGNGDDTLWFDDVTVDSAPVDC
ncbi:hypothetical protein ACIBCU_11885, partial [Streptomyces sp. NPDC051064]